MGGGHLDETPLVSAKRELREETGLTATKWTELLRIHTSNCVTDELGIAYIAENLQQGETDFDDTEQLEIQKLPLREAIEMVMNGQITDSMSMAALLKVARLYQL